MEPTTWGQKGHFSTHFLSGVARESQNLTSRSSGSVIQNGIPLPMMVFEIEVRLESIAHALGLIHHLIVSFYCTSCLASLTPPGAPSGTSLVTAALYIRLRGFTSATFQLVPTHGIPRLAEKGPAGLPNRRRHWVAVDPATSF